MSTNKREVHPHDIAIIGISSVLASGSNLNENWESIRQGLNHVAELPADRVDITAYYNPEKTAKDQIYCKQGFFIPDYEIDPRDYGLNFNQVEDADANQLLTLLKVKEALSDAKISPSSKDKKNVGVVLGLVGGAKASHEFYSRLNYVVMEKVLRKMGMSDEDTKVAIEKYKAQFPEWRVDSFPGFLGNVTAGRCCNVFNLDGMNCVVDAACASSLIALKVAIDEILFGDCDTMVVGATCTDNSLGMYMAFSKTPVFSTDPSVKAYDESTKGMLIGEGSVMLVIKKLSKAIEDGDEIHAVIRGVASSSDGKTPGIYVPTVSGQELCIERAWQKCGLDLNTCTLLEGHGTGTPVGDRIELTGMRNQFGIAGKCAQEQIAVGSIKSQVGHTKAVAGFAGLIKVVLALKHKVLPKTINVNNPPTFMDYSKMSDSCLYLNTRNRPWFVPKEIGIRRAGLSSFGFGGANYHMVVEEYEQEQTKPYRMHDSALPIVICASNAQALKQKLSQLASSVTALATQEEQYDRLIDIRNENQVGNVTMPQDHARVGMLVNDKPEDFVQSIQLLVEAIRDDQLEEAKPRADLLYRRRGLPAGGKVGAVFAGHGTQYLHMFDEVAMNWPEFRTAVVDIDNKSSGLRNVLYPRAPYASEIELLAKQERELELHAQEAITAASVGSFAVFQRAGFKPDFVAGHSLGEFAALHASGALDRSNLAELISVRANAMRTATAEGGKMIAVIGDAKKIKPETDGVYLANYNSPNQVVLSGPAAKVDAEAAKWRSRSGFQVVDLKTGSQAFHTPQMAQAERTFYDKLAITKVQAPQIKTLCASTGKEYTTAENVKQQLAKQMTSPVNFTAQVETMYAQGVRVFVEFGPGNVLSKLVNQTLQGKEHACVSVNPSATKNSDLQLREAALQAAVLGVAFTSAFDPWTARNPFKGLRGFFDDVEQTKKAKASKTKVIMGAATYVSKKTLAERKRVMEDGQKFKCFASPSQVPASTLKADVEEELQRLKQQLQQVKQETAKSEQECVTLKRSLEDAQEHRASLEEINQRFHLEKLLQDYEMLTKQLKDALLGKPVELHVPSKASPVRPVVRQAPVAAAPKPAAAVAPTSTGGLSRDEITKVLQKVLSESTGFDEGMLTNDLNLEEDLGIDSIKRVEFVSNVSGVFNVTVGPEAMDKLARTRLVGEVVEVFVNDVFGGVSAAPKSVAAPKAVAVPKAATAPQATTGGLSRDEITKVLQKVLSESTGFDEAMLTDDLNLEEDLGIDSIKRVEFVSNVSGVFNVTVGSEAMDKLARTRLVGEVVEVFVNDVFGGVSPTAAPKAAASAPASSTPGGLSRDEITKVLQKVLSESTGFDEAMLTNDLNLEEDLGIDSIKRVEFVSNVSGQFGVSVGPEAMDKLARTRLVGEVVEVFVHDVFGGASPTAAPKAATSTSNASNRDHIVSVLQRVLSESTGFDESMLTNDLNLEEDLGIDSIKRVEFVSNVSSVLNITVGPEAMDKLARTRLVGEVVEVFTNL